MLQYPSRGCTAQEPPCCCRRKVSRPGPSQLYLLSSSFGQDLALSGHSLALQHCLTRLLQLPNTPICTGTACPMPGAPRACRMLNTCSKDKGTNKPTDLPEPHGRILVCPSAPPNSCDVSQDQEFGNTIPLSKQQTSHGCHHGHALCPCHGHPWIPVSCVPLDASASQLRCNHPRTCCSLNQTALLDHSLPPLWEAAAGNERPSHTGRV